MLATVSDICVRFLPIENFLTVCHRTPKTQLAAHFDLKPSRNRRFPAVLLPVVDTARRGMTAANTIRPQPLGTYKDAAALIQCSERQAMRLYARGIIPGIRLGRLVRFDLDAVCRALTKKGGRA